jgi:hypothetical protein
VAEALSRMMVKSLLCQKIDILGRDFKWVESALQIAGHFLCSFKTSISAGACPVSNPVFVNRENALPLRSMESLNLCL